MDDSKDIQSLTLFQGKDGGSRSRTAHTLYSCRRWNEVSCTNRLSRNPHKYLDLNIIHGICANFETKGHFDVVGQSFLVALFDCSPLGTESLAFGVRKQSFQLGELLQPGTRAQLEGLRNERAQLGIALD